MDCSEQAYCICVHCNIVVAHTKGIPCKEVVCEKCGKRMIRQGGYHHTLYLKKQTKEK
ncbi:MAG TPA: hypothetical protein P5243_07450 [Bacteroidales bacterium]|jgi:hypothetical protein|nr:hypothetical protein [Bacteroidales bacterium]HRS19323.1 hypothetical protein [Bacteroidales bacterium]